MVSEEHVLHIFESGILYSHEVTCCYVNCWFWNGVANFLKLKDWDSVSAQNVQEVTLSNLQVVVEDYGGISCWGDFVKHDLNQGEAVIGLRD